MDFSFIYRLIFDQNMYFALTLRERRKCFRFMSYYFFHSYQQEVRNWYRDHFQYQRRSGISESISPRSCYHKLFFTLPISLSLYFLSPFLKCQYRIIDFVNLSYILLLQLCNYQWCTFWINKKNNLHKFIWRNIRILSTSITNQITYNIFYRFIYSLFCIL